MLDEFQKQQLNRHFDTCLNEMLSCPICKHERFNYQGITIERLHGFNEIFSGQLNNSKTFAGVPSVLIECGFCNALLKFSAKSIFDNHLTYTEYAETMGMI
jgi:hypothetical protein